MLLAMAERRFGVAERLARRFPDRRDPSRIAHRLVDMIRARIFAIGCGYEDADNLDFPRFDPAFELACGRLPDTGSDPCSQAERTALRFRQLMVAAACPEPELLCSMRTATIMPGGP